MGKIKIPIKPCKIFTLNIKSLLVCVKYSRFLHFCVTEGIAFKIQSVASGEQTETERPSATAPFHHRMDGHRRKKEDDGKDKGSIRRR
ncbi:hypothetical protein DESC_680009 [Desulfosarcina cetonica]|nr:hypothetical protein DESC_680009 [Desulfosarcina cetonica]